MSVIQSTSCIDSGRNNAVPRDKADLDSDEDFNEFMPFDFDGDGIINEADLIQLLSEWGQCDSCCLADLDVNGSVSTTDLLIFLSYWN